MREPINAEVCCMESQQKRLSRNTAIFRKGPSQRGVQSVPAILHARPLFANAVLVSSRHRRTTHVDLRKGRSSTHSKRNSDWITGENNLLTLQTFSSGSDQWSLQIMQKGTVQIWARMHPCARKGRTKRMGTRIPTKRKRETHKGAVPRRGRNVDIRNFERIRRRSCDRSRWS